MNLNFPAHNYNCKYFTGFYAGQFNQGIRDGHGVRVFYPNTKLKDAFANKTMTDSSSEVPSATDLERLLGDKIFSEFEEGDVSGRTEEFIHRN